MTTPKASRNKAQGCRAESVATQGQRCEKPDNPVWVAERLRFADGMQLQRTCFIAQPFQGCSDPVFRFPR